MHLPAQPSRKSRCTSSDPNFHSVHLYLINEMTHRKINPIASELDPVVVSPAWAPAPGGEVGEFPFVWCTVAGERKAKTMEDSKVTNN